MIRKIIYRLHGLLGALLSILFLLWFLSGFVMIYHRFPRISNQQRIEKMDALTEHLPSINEIFGRLPEGVIPQKVTLSCDFGENLFTFNCLDTTVVILSDSLGKQPSIDMNRIKKVQERWCSAPIMRIDSLYTLDQWIPFGRLKKEFPIYKYYFEDNLKHELYISSKTGNVLQLTNANSRFWGMIGAVPHWVYYTMLRQHRSLWWWFVVLTSGIGCFMSLGGLYLAIKPFKSAIKKKGRLFSPYRKKVYRWHHISGTFFGIFTITFAFSGMMSMTPVPQWIAKTHSSLNIEKELKGAEFSPDHYLLDYREVMTLSSVPIKQVEWSSFGGIPLYKITSDSCLQVIDASTSTPTPLVLTEPLLLGIFNKIYGESVHVEVFLMTEYDNYYLSRRNPPPLPVYKVMISNEDRSRYYINPQTAEYRYFDNNRRWRKWLYSGLHNYSISWLIERPLLWNLVMWGSMLGGTFVSLTGLILSYRYVRRKTRKRRH